jgi:hypothetical protein
MFLPICQAIVSKSITLRILVCSKFQLALKFPILALIARCGTNLHFLELCKVI